MPEMTPLEAAESLERKAELFPGMADLLLFVASYLRKIAAGEYKQVVHCKDCIAWEEKEGYFPRCLIRAKADFRPHKDGFCDMGQRKDDSHA